MIVFFFFWYVQNFSNSNEFGLVLDPTHLKCLSQMVYTPDSTQKPYVIFQQKIKDVKPQAIRHLNRCLQSIPKINHVLVVVFSIPKVNSSNDVVNNFTSLSKIHSVSCRLAVVRLLLFTCSINKQVCQANQILCGFCGMM